MKVGRGGRGEERFRGMVNPYHEDGEREEGRGEVKWYTKSISRRWGEGGGRGRLRGSVNPYHEGGERGGGRGEVKW